VPSALRLQADCTQHASDLDAGAWICPAPRTAECGRADPDAVETVFVTPDSESTCAALSPTVDEGPYGPGTHEIAVTNGAAADASSDAGAALCTATLEVVDTLAPEVTPKEVTLWPPNHQMQSVTLDDCFTATDRCDADLDAHFTWATSDEPANGRGDGHHEPDIVIDDCSTVALRAERSGGEDGRVYELGYNVMDDAGNVTRGVCRVVVPHDQASEAVAGPPVTRVVTPATCTAQTRDGGAGR
jgi:hypothetical protein